MSLTPLAIHKMRFARQMRGYSPQEVESFLELVAEELTKTLTECDHLRQEKDRLAERLERTEARERELQDTLLRAQKVSDEIVATSHREAQLLVKEAEITADKIVQQAIEQAKVIEGKIQELRHRRRELQLKLKNTVDFFTKILEGEMAEEDDHRATIHRLPRTKQSEGAAG